MFFVQFAVRRTLLVTVVLAYCYTKYKNKPENPSNCLKVGSNTLHLLEYIFGVNNTLRVYLKLGTFTLTQVLFL